MHVTREALQPQQQVDEEFARIHGVLGDSEGSEAVEVVWCCLVVSLDRFCCSVLFAIHSAWLALSSARLIPFRQAPGPLHVVMGA